MSQTSNSQAKPARQRKSSLPPSLPDDVTDIPMWDLLELEPPPSDEELERNYSAALKELWHEEFNGEFSYNFRLFFNLERCVRTRPLHPPSLTFHVFVGFVQGRPLSRVLSATMRTPYSKTKVKAAVDRWIPKLETAEEQEEEDGDWVASSKSSGTDRTLLLSFFFTAGVSSIINDNTDVKSSSKVTSTSSSQGSIRRPDYVLEVTCRHVGGRKSTSIPLSIEIKAFPLNDFGHPQSQSEADKAFVKGLSQTAMYALAGWEMYRYRRSLFICGPAFCRVCVLDDNVLAVEVSSPPTSLSPLNVPSFFSSYSYGSMPHNLISPLANEESVSPTLFKHNPDYTINPLSCRLLESFIRGTLERTLRQTVGEALGCQAEEMDTDYLSASHSGIAFATLTPLSNRQDLVAHARDNATISKAANSGASRKKKASSKKGSYLKTRGNRRDPGGESGGDRGASGGDGDGRGDTGGGNGERGGDGGAHFSGSGFARDEGGEDTGDKRTHNLSGPHDKDLPIEALDSSPEAESVVWKESGCLAKPNGRNRECFFGLVGPFIDTLNPRI